jgi:N-formylglutamate amidohydrolase
MLTTNDHLVSHTCGVAPIVLVCGHDGQEAPQGVGLRQRYLPGRDLPTFSVQRDLNTYQFTLQLAEAYITLTANAPYVVCADFSRKYIDVNRSRWFGYDAPRCMARPFYDAFHRQIKEYRKAIGTGLLLDIHGTSIPGADLYLGTVYHNSIANLWVVKALTGGLAACGYSVVMNHPRLSGGFTVLAHGDFAGGIDAIQLEIGRHLRDAGPLQTKLANDLANVLAVLTAGYAQLIGTFTKRSGKSTVTPISL